MLKFWASMFAVSLFVAGCTDGNESATEPVGKEEAPPSIPDMPGDSGETTAKPAGAGEAGELPAAEKSQPNVEAANRKSPTAAVESGAVRTGALNVRSGPGMKHSVVRVLQSGEKVKLTNCGTVWCQIGESEYVSKRFVAD